MPSTRGALHSVRVALWGETPPSKAEQRLLFKIDWFILSFCCLAHVPPGLVYVVAMRRSYCNCNCNCADRARRYFSNYLDRANINNAYVSGTWLAGFCGACRGAGLIVGRRHEGGPPYAWEPDHKDQHHLQLWVCMLLVLEEDALLA